jgi:hypothetical protein
VTAEVATGFTVFQVKLVLQLLLPAAIVQLVALIVPDMAVETLHVPDGTSQTVPRTQEAVAITPEPNGDSVVGTSDLPLLFKKKVLAPYGTLAETFVPLFPLPTTVLAAGVLEITLETPSGFVVVQFKLVLQLLLPATIVQLVALRVPDMAVETLHVPDGTSQAVPEVQLAKAVTPPAGLSSTSLL